MLPNLVIASYRGTAPLVTDVMGGQLTMGLVTYPGVISYFQSGRVGISAVFDTERLPQLPQVVSTSEAGFPQLRAVAWFGLFAPKRTPPAQLSAISKAVQLARNDPDFQQRMAGMGAVMVLNTPAEFATTIKSGDETWRALAKRFPLE